MEELIYILKDLLGRRFEGRSTSTNAGIQVAIQYENMSEWQKSYKDLV